MSVANWIKSTRLGTDFAYYTKPYSKRLGNTRNNKKISYLLSHIFVMSILKLTLRGLKLILPILNLVLSILKPILPVLEPIVHCDLI